MKSDLRPLSSIFVLVGTVIPGLASAQAHRVTRPPTELLSAFEREYQTSSGPTSGAGSDIVQVVTYPESYPAADLEQFTRGLEQLALKGNSSRVRASAVMNLALLGSRRKAHPVSGTMSRLQGIYNKSNDPIVRSMVVVGMADISERPKALGFLERIATQPAEASDFPGAASRALGSLVAMDDEGRAVLKRLYESRAVRDPGAKLELSTLSQRGFRVP
jgi:hypothetical protein